MTMICRRWLADISPKWPETFSLDYISVSSGTVTTPTATIKLKKSDGKNAPVLLQDASIGDGPVDAALKAIDRLTSTKGQLMDYSLRAVSQGKDALGEGDSEGELWDGKYCAGKRGEHRCHRSQCARLSKRGQSASLCRQGKR